MGRIGNPAGRGVVQMRTCGLDSPALWVFWAGVAALALGEGAGASEVEGPVPVSRASENVKYGIQAHDGGTITAESWDGSEHHFRWSIKRPNRLFPLGAYVTNDGKYVVLRDEVNDDWNSGELAHGKMLVFLGPGGKLLAEYDYADLLPAGEVALDYYLTNQLEWSWQARFFLWRAERQFVFATKRLTMGLFDVATGQRLALTSQDKKAIRDELLRIAWEEFDSDCGGTMECGATWLGILRERKAVPKLEQLLTNTPWGTPSSYTTEVAARTLMAILGDDAVPIIESKRPHPDHYVDRALGRVLGDPRVLAQDAEDTRRAREAEEYWWGAPPEPHWWNSMEWWGRNPMAMVGAVVLGLLVLMLAASLLKRRRGRRTRQASDSPDGAGDGS